MLMKGMINELRLEMSVEDRGLFHRRVANFLLPTHVPNIVRGWKPNKKIGNTISMKMFWQLS